MQIFLDTTAAFLDASILTIYLSSTLNKFKKEKALWYIISLILIEVLLYVNQSWIASIDSPVFTGMSTIISIVTTFIASLFFISKMHVRILAAAFFQVLFNISETVFSYLVLHFQPDIMDIDDPHLLYAVMGFGTTIFFLFLILALRLLLKKNRHRYPIQFNLLLLLVPAMTVILLSVIDSRSFYNSGNITAYILFTVMLSLINIINYVQIQWSARFLQDRHQIAEMKKQFSYQRQKYDQLSDAYRSGRKLMHDTKKHLFVIQEYIDKQDTEALSTYVQNLSDDMENLYNARYARYNTGNLVIDSFISSFHNMSENKMIQFEAILKVDQNRIPLTDYDLCVVLGNLLDNALTACDDARIENRFIKIHIETTTNDLFIIKEENSMNPDKRPVLSDNPEHGYGLKNIESTINDYHGILHTTQNNTFSIYIRIPITAREQRLVNPLYPPEKFIIPDIIKISNDEKKAK